MSKMSLADRLFIGIFPGGISYADRSKEEHGDYKRIAFLPYDTLELDVYDARSPLINDIRAHAKILQSRRGQTFEVSSSGHTVLLGARR